MTDRQHRKQGFTLVEIMVGMALVTIMTLALASTFLVASRSLTNEARIISADTAVSHASFSLSRDLASAATIPIGTVSAAPASNLTLNYGSPPVSVTYSVDANSELIRTVNGVAGVAARGITSVTISAPGCYSTVTIQPSAVGAAAVTLNVSNRPGGCY